MTDDRDGDKLFEVETGPVPARAVTPVGTQKRFRHYDQSQSFLLPPSLDDWLPEDHEARFISDVVDTMLDLSCVYDSYTEASGAPPYDPEMMLKLLLYAYSIGVTSSREMERRCHTDVAFRWLSANAAPDYRSISRFRRRHLGAIDALFVQVLALCAEAGLVKLGRVALDGTKLRASASRHKAMSYDRMRPRIEELEAQVAAMLAEAEATDLAEDEEFGEDKRGDELPPELATKQGRLAKLRAAKEAIEAEARDKAAQKAQDKAKEQDATEHEAQAAAAAAAEGATPPGRAQRNFTDPESRMMKTTDGFHYAFNAQAVVDEEAQVILAQSVSNQAADAPAPDGDDRDHRSQPRRCGHRGGSRHRHRRRRILLREERDRCHRRRRRRIDCHRAHQAPRAGADSTERSHPKRCHGQRDDGAPTAHQSRTGRLRQTQGHRRAGFRSDEGPTRRRVPPSARSTGCTR